MDLWCLIFAGTDRLDGMGWDGMLPTVLYLTAVPLSHVPDFSAALLLPPSWIFRAQRNASHWIIGLGRNPAILPRTPQYQPGRKSGGSRSALPFSSVLVLGRGRC
ncbi:hypothetical protein ONS96_003946 [Cadophora gregata f. sp. sojae]|nr:hypothetical protein ONS96_003946 [Cadophora gregata f. sp. sojae]